GRMVASERPGEGPRAAWPKRFLPAPLQPSIAKTAIRLGPTPGGRPAFAALGVQGECQMGERNGRTATRRSLYFVVLVLTAGVGRAEDPVREIVLRDGVVLPVGGRQGRAALQADPVASQLVEGRWRTPQAGDSIELPGGTTRTWEKVAADEK